MGSATCLGCLVPAAAVDEHGYGGDVGFHVLGSHADAVGESAQFYIGWVGTEGTLVGEGFGELPQVELVGLLEQLSDCAEGGKQASAPE